MTHNSIIFKVFPQQTKAANTEWSMIFWPNDELKNNQKFQIKEPYKSFPIMYSLETLQPDTTYYYFFTFGNQTYDLDVLYLNRDYPYQILQRTFEFDENISANTPLFKFRTLGIPKKPYSFNISFSACARTGSENAIFYDVYKVSNPQIFFMLGDLHYNDISTDSVELFEQAYNSVFSSLVQSYLYQQVPIIYIYDDHDFGPNDADGNTKSRNAANIAYHNYVPHSDLHSYDYLNIVNDSTNVWRTSINKVDPQKKFTEQEFGLYRIQIIGRVALMIMDGRTFQNTQPKNATDPTCVGPIQMEWMNNVFDALENDTDIKGIVFVSSFNFNGNGNGHTWKEFPKERLHIADRLSYLQEKKNKTVAVFIVSSDAHMTAFYNGKGYFIGNLSSKYKRGIPEAQCGSLDKQESCKGGTFTYGPWPGRNHFTNMKVIDDGSDQVCILFTGYEYEHMLFTYDSCDKHDQNLNSMNDCPITLTWRILGPFIAIAIIIILGSLLALCTYFIKRKFLSSPNLLQNNYEKVQILQQKP